MKALGICFAGILIVVLLLGLSWVVQGNDFFLYKYFAPKYADVQREVFQNTKAYNQGLAQELDSWRIEYAKGDAETKKMLASIVRQRTADYDLNRFPIELREFVQQCKDLPLTETKTMEKKEY